METPTTVPSNGQPINGNLRYNDSLEKVIDELKTKARHCQASARIYFILIFIVIVSGLITFTFAYKFTASNQVVDVVKTQAKSMKNVVATAGKLDSALTVKLYNQVHTINVNGVDEIAEADPVYRLINNRYDKLLTSLHTMNQELVDVIEKDNQASTLNFLETLSTKVGSVIMVLFLVQILIRIFRYNRRLADFYSARANALEIGMQNKGLQIETIVAMLSSDSIDIGNTKTPTDHFAEIIKAIAAKAPSKVE